MKTYQEFSKATVSLTEASITSEVIAANKGREGKPMISLADGQEIKNTVYLGDGWSAKKDGATIVISPAQESSIMKSMYISVKQLDILKKAF